MFRRLESSLPKDFIFPDDMKGMGYFINDNDQIRSIEDPELGFHYWCSKNERYLERHKEAMNEHIRRNVINRLTASTMELTPLPLGTPVEHPHSPILTSKNLADCRRCIVYIGQSSQDLGIIAGRLMEAESVAAGSVIQLVNAIHKPGTSTMNDGIIIANPGQLVWYRRGKKAMTYESWYSLPRATAVSPALSLGKGNQIPRNHTSDQHVECLFEDVVAPLAERGCKINIIAIGGGGIETADFLQKDWAKWKDAVQAIAVGSGRVWDTEFYDEDFMTFWGKRARAYIVSDESVGVPLTGRQLFGCNVFASGESQHEECILPRAYSFILDYFKLVNHMPGYENPVLEIEDDDPGPMESTTFNHIPPVGLDELSDIDEDGEKEEHGINAEGRNDPGNPEDHTAVSNVTRQELENGNSWDVHKQLSQLSIQDEGSMKKENVKISVVVSENDAVIEEVIMADREGNAE